MQAYHSPQRRPPHQRPPQTRPFKRVTPPSRMRETMVLSILLHIMIIWQVAVHVGNLPPPSKEPLRVILNIGLPIYDATSIITEEALLPDLPLPSKPKSQPNPKPSISPQPKVQPLPKPQANPKPRPELLPEIKPLPKLALPPLESPSETKSQSKPLPKPEPLPEIKPTPELPLPPLNLPEEPKPLPKLEPNPEPLPEIKPILEPKPEPIPELKPPPVPEPKPEPLPEIKPILEPKPEPIPELKPPPVPELEPLPELKPRTEPPANTATKPDDFFMMLKRKQAQRLAEEMAVKRVNDAAREAERQPTEEERRTKNIFSNLRFGSNGLFQIKRMDPLNATFSFKGWTTDYSSANTRFYEVEAQSGQDIRLVIVRRMISIIREHYDGNFVWESHRLRRNVDLSARLEDTAQLEEFLMVEFFGPNYKTQDPLRY